MMRYLIANFQKTFREINYKYNVFNVFNYTKPLLKNNDILSDNIFVRKKIPFNEQWENKDFYRKNAK
tara:strand:- start:1081 stop:1281 length:201 start_codon:yes stop_codon:yes gene_type:complete